jgi:hypothetical protein
MADPLTRYGRWDLVEVVWEDAQHDPAFDAPVEDDAGDVLRLALVHSVGYYVEGDKKRVTLASSRGPRNNSARFLIAIPRSGIKKMAVVRRATREGSGG